MGFDDFGVLHSAYLMLFEIIFTISAYTFYTDRMIETNANVGWISLKFACGIFDNCCGYYCWVLYSPDYENIQFDIQEIMIFCIF